MREERRVRDQDMLDVTNSPELLRLAEEVNTTCRTLALVQRQEAGGYHAAPGGAYAPPQVARADGTRLRGLRVGTGKLEQRRWRSASQGYL